VALVDGAAPDPGDGSVRWVEAKVANDDGSAHDPAKLAQALEELLS
jgi:hypothetical protein